eukprot:CAMPEP_0182592158 /NCGR_PEP_ID=MMETSP1324-20130603/75349_1 /TAXON_ID=236786 /ORGANISM="Florenciella sp., Strain RCC1587" /LENGTH=80 /DNA_ID=CAMNT_0024809533 /DNA_START=94 /DNA_END=336 /DNA_ORIENTATION=-
MASSSTFTPSTRAPPPLIKRRASPFDLAKLSSTRISTTGLPASSSLDGTCTLGRSAVSPSAPLLNTLLAVCLIDSRHSAP